MVMQPSWSLHLLSEILAAFSTEDPENLRNVVNRVAESVEAEVAAILSDGTIRFCIGMTGDERQQLESLASSRPPQITIGAGRLNTYWAPLGEGNLLVVGRLGDTFDVEERSLLRAMARSIELSLRMLEAISAERQARLDASYQACHDALTDLPNRLLVLERLCRWTQQPPDDGACGTAVLFIDIDRFKWVNDAHGHAAGDELLVHVSRILQRSVRRDDLVGRLSGDEFIVITRTRKPEAASELAQRIITAIRRPIRVAGTELSHSASVGICLAQPGDTASLLIENADMAMYRAKALGRGRYALFQPSMREEARNRLALEEALRHAVGNGEIVCHLQPIVRLADRQLVGFEALARWKHPQQGLLTPSAFIAAAEDSGLIEGIDLWMMEAACRALGRWQQLPGLEHLRLSVNVSARTLSAADLVQRIEPILAASGIAPSRLFLEITETSLVEDIQSTTSTIQGLRHLGLKLAIDDFGTGYSSLLYLKRFPVGLLKIDQSFVADLGSDPEDEAIAQAIVSLAGALGVSVVAEGVETETQEARLLELGSDYAQGYLYGPGLDIEATEGLLIEPALPRSQPGLSLKAIDRS
jgi:Amt family ammonium transporter